MEISLKSRLEKVLREVSSYSHFGGIYYPIDGKPNVVLGKGVCRLCSGCVNHARTGALCRNSACTGAVQGQAIGDVWYFRCWLGLDALVVPIAPGNEIVGALEVGGWLNPGDRQNAEENALSRLASLDTRSMNEFSVTALQGMPELPFTQVKALGEFVLETTFAQGLNEPSTFEIRRKVYEQQQRLSRRIQHVEMEREPYARILISLQKLASVLHGNSDELVQSLDDYLSQTLVQCRGDMPQARAAVCMLMSMLLLDQVSTGSSWHAAMTRFEERLLESEKIDNTQALCFWVENLMMKHRARSRTTEKTEAETLGDKVIGWLRKHFSEKIRLENAANELGASRSTIVHRLRPETGKTFAEHLRIIRVNEAKRLLAYTSLSLTEIASRCGFKDQSYFTKVFRGEINLTPSEFRRMLNSPHTQG